MSPRSAPGGRRVPGGPAAVLSPAALVRGSRTPLALAAALAWCSTGIFLALPRALSGMGAALVRGEPVIGPVAALTALTLAAYACQAGCGRLLARAGERVVLGLRERLAHHVLRLPLPDVRARGTGDLSAQIIFDTAQVRVALESGLVHLPAALFGVLAVLTAMTRLDPRLTLVAVGSFVLVGGPLAGVLARTRRVVAAQLQALGRLNQRLLNCLQTLAVIKTCRYEAAAAAALRQAAADYGAASAAATRSQAVVGPLVGLAQQLAVTAVTLTAAHRVGAGSLSLETSGTFFFLLLCLGSPVTVLALGAGQLRTGQAARARLTALLASPGEEEAAPPPRPAHRSSGTGGGGALGGGAAATGEVALVGETVPVGEAVPAGGVGGAGGTGGAVGAGGAVPVGGAALTGAAVIFDGVTFAHPDSPPVLRNLSFTVPATGLTLLVGPSGAGKSTALALITGLLRTEHGRIHVLGREIGSWRLSRLRRRVAYAEQHATVWEGTVRENLRMGCGPQAGDDVLWDALDAVGLTETVEGLPDGLGTVLGGSRALSGGQCQRLSLARALLTGADLLVLDEPTSQVDTAGEQHVFGTLSRLAATRPVLMATHRPHSLPGVAHVITIAPPPPARVSRSRSARPGEPVTSRP
ncbi:ABC transporter ATP-binding protein [Streptomyces sp. CA-181903]|uniref:ABC transporter ATP-binding protein n=1 Tax=Streptomyces sp. CA-181903 TaxID=3240055 RepID=UPI003D8F9D34